MYFCRASNKQSTKSRWFSVFNMWIGGAGLELIFSYVPHGDKPCPSQLFMYLIYYIFVFLCSVCLCLLLPSPQKHVLPTWENETLNKLLCDWSSLRVSWPSIRQITFTWEMDVCESLYSLLVCGTLFWFPDKDLCYTQMLLSEKMFASSLELQKSIFWAVWLK